MVSYWYWEKEKVHSGARHIAEKLSEEIIRVLLVFHTHTGCDSTSAPFGCGKMRHFVCERRT